MKFKSKISCYRSWWCCCNRCVSKECEKNGIIDTISRKAKETTDIIVDTAKGLVSKIGQTAKGFGNTVANTTKNMLNKSIV